MKTTNFLRMAAAALLISGMTASSALAVDSATGTGTGEVVQALQIANVSDLDWGTFSPDVNAEGTITIDANASGAQQVAAVAIGLAPGQRGTMNVTGDPNRVYTTTLSSNPHIFTGLGNSANTMQAILEVDGFHGGGLGSAAPLDATGNSLTGIGGVLTVGISQAVDVYTGDYTITVNY